MRLSTTKKLSAVMAGLALSMTLAAPAFGATLGGDKGTAGVSTDTDASLSINKSVLIANDEDGAASGLKVSYPAMSFKYNVAPDTNVNATVTDASGATAKVKPGVPGGLKTNGKIDIARGSVVLNNQGAEVVSGSLKIEIVPKAFEGTGAGIYRYVISDDTDVAALNANGVTRGASTDTEYYLDVYIKNADEGGLEPGGYVLLDVDDPEVKPDDTSKKSGIDDVPVDPVDPQPTPDDPSDDYKLSGTVTDDTFKTNDYYETFNATLTKKITGIMGDKTHAFPFKAELDNYGLGYQTTSAATLADPADGIKTEIKTTLANDGVLKIWGLSPLATVNYTETNDTVSTYKTTVAAKAATLEGKNSVDVASNGTIAAYDGLTKIATYNNKARSTADDASEITFTNHLDQISPTGVVMRFAPYVAIMAAGLVLLMFTKSNKAYEEE